MKNKILIIIAAILLVAIGAGIGVFLAKNNKSGDLNQENARPEDNKPISEEQKSQFRTVAKDYFSLSVPDNWLEANAPSGVSLIMANTSENITNPDAKKINFRSYFSVTYDKPGEKNKKEYMEALKEGLKQSIPGIVFTEKNAIKINGKESSVLEADLTQQGIDLKLLMFLIDGKDKDIWIMSFNTIKDNWSGYETMFYQIAESFRVK